jgi:hypothetical protein
MNKLKKMQQNVKKIQTTHLRVTQLGVVLIIPIFAFATVSQSYALIPDAAGISSVKGRANVPGKVVQVRREGDSSSIKNVFPNRTILKSYVDVLDVPASNNLTATLDFLFKETTVWKYAKFRAQTVPRPTPSEYRLPCRAGGGTFTLGWGSAGENKERGCEEGVPAGPSSFEGAPLSSLKLLNSIQATKSLNLAQAAPSSVLFCGARPKLGLFVAASGVNDESCQEIVQRCTEANGGSECSLVSMGKWDISDPNLNAVMECDKGPLRGQANGSQMGNVLSDLTQRAASDSLTGCAFNVYAPGEQIIKPGSGQTLVQGTDTGRGINVDVLIGSVVIRSISKPLGISVKAGQRYSTVDNTTTPIDPKQIAQTSEIQDFLDPKQALSPDLPPKIAEEIAAQIADHRVALGLPPIAPLSSYYLRVTSGSGSITSSRIPAVAAGKTVNQVTGGYDPSTRTLRLDIAGRQVEMILNAPLNDNVPIAFKVERVRPRFDRESTVSQFPKLVQNILAITEVEGGGTLRKQGNQIRGDFTVRGGFLGGRFNIQGNSSTFFPSSPSREGKSLATGKFLLNVQIGTSSNIPAKR